jgi:hypothetical protein
MHLLVSLLWEAGKKSVGKRPRFAKTLSNISAFTCPRDSVGSPLRRNRLDVPSQPLRPTGKLEFLGASGFCQIWIPNYSLLAKSLYETTKGRMGAFHMGKGARESY